MKTAIARTDDEGRIIFSSNEKEFLMQGEDANYITDDGYLLDYRSIIQTLDFFVSLGYDVQLTDAVIKLIKISIDTSYDLSMSISHSGLELYDFQKNGVLFSRKHDRALFNWSTGTGKSILGLCIMADQLDAGNVDRVFVLVPRHLIPEWKSRIEQYTTLTLGVVHDGMTPKKREIFYKDNSAQVWIVGHEKARLVDSKDIVAANKGKRITIIYDEFQKVRRRTSAIHKSTDKLVKALKANLYALTATPMERSPDDFYNIWRVLKPTIFGLVKNYEHNFTYLDGARDMYRNYLGYQNVKRMRGLTGHLIHSVDKTSPEIAKFFPARDEIKKVITLNQADQKLYDKVIQMTRDEFERTQDKTILLIGAGVARGVCNIPYKLYESLSKSEHYFSQRLAEIFKDVQPSKTNKIITVEQLVSEIIESGEKVIIFCTWTNNGIIPLSEHFKQYDPLMYHGGMTSAKQDEAEHLFKTDPTRQLIFMSDAGKEGFNFKMAKYVIHFNTPFLWSHYVQRSDRVHRIDSDMDSITIFRIETLGTVEVGTEEMMSSRRIDSATLGLGGEFEDGTEVMVESDLEMLLFGNTSVL